MTDDVLTLAGRDMTSFVTNWFEDLREGGGQMRGLLDDGPEMADMFLMGNIASRAAEMNSTDEELLLFAALAIANSHMRDTGGSPLLHDWDEMWGYVLAAFNYVHELGEERAALRLVQDVFREVAGKSKSRIEFEQTFPSKLDDAGQAAHERLMASLDQRSIRAAKLLDPSIDIDQVMLMMPPPED